MRRKVESVAMDDISYKSPETPPVLAPHLSKRQTLAWALAAMAFAAGLPVGFFSVVVGAHGNVPWPTATLCAPAYLVATCLGDNLGYVAAMILGTSAFYALYAYLVVRWPLRGFVAALCIHGGAMLITIPML